LSEEVKEEKLGQGKSKSSKKTKKEQPKFSSSHAHMVGEQTDAAHWNSQLTERKRNLQNWRKWSAE
jgi:hypothetical protein